MDEPGQVVNLCGNCEAGRCEFFVKFVPGGKNRVLTCTKRADFISSLPGFLDVELISPPTELAAQYGSCYCRFCEALVFGDQAPGFRFETGQIICQDCIKGIDHMTVKRPRCNHLSLLSTEQTIHTNHTHWLALPPTEDHHVEMGIYCDERLIPDDQRVNVGVWHCFKVKEGHLDFLRSVFDQVGLKNELLCSLIHMALNESFNTPLEDFFLYE